MRALGNFFMILFTTLVLGVGSAVYVVEANKFGSDIAIGPWKGNSLAGSSSANLYDRAIIARSAMLALNREEAIYFIADTDDTGKALSSSCRYSVTGTDMPARWWSITVYGDDYFLIPSEDNKYSFTRTDMPADSPVYVYELARTGSGAEGSGNPLLINGNRPNRAFSLLLRLYHPDPSMLHRPEGLAVPQITNLGCGA